MRRFPEFFKSIQITFLQSVCFHTLTSDEIFHRKIIMIVKDFLESS